ncbi:MAG: right-handed parallel beta-helix repeat-containing protein [Myxococcota bacterium]|jgi:hypothetical protein|nr:right-handed parallel beta-helix repeat-containing protein [Myxococcota bacterium]
MNRRRLLGGGVWQLCWLLGGVLLACGEPEPVAAATVTPAEEAAGSDPARYPSIVELQRAEFPPDPGRSPTPAGGVLHVQPGGSGPGTLAQPCGAIAEALRLARTGDTVLVQPGTYLEGLPGESVALQLGEPGVTLLGSTAGRVLVQPARPGVRHGLVVEADGVRVIGIDIAGFAGASVIFGSTRGQRDVVLRSMRLEAPSDGQWHDGIVATADNRATGVPVLAGLRVQDVQIGGGVSLGLSCNAGPCRSWRLHDVVLQGGSGVGSGADGIAIENGENLLLTAVQVRGFPADGIDLKAKGVVIYDTIVGHVGRNGIKLWYEGDIVNTLIHHTGADAGLVLAGPGRLRLLHSVLAYHNWNGPSSYHMTFGYPDLPVAVEIRNSLIYRCSGGGYVSGGSTLQVHDSLWSDIANGVALDFAGADGVRQQVRLGDPAGRWEELGLGRGRLTVGTDPRLAATEPFDPLPGSPLIDAGSPAALAYPPWDARGAPRSRGAGPDIGPREQPPPP